MALVEVLGAQGIPGPFLIGLLPCMVLGLFAGVKVLSLTSGKLYLMNHPLQKSTTHLKGPATFCS